MAENFSQVMKNVEPQIQEAQHKSIPNRINKNNSQPYTL